MTDSLDRFLQDLHFDPPVGLVQGAKRAAAAQAHGNGDHHIERIRPKAGDAFRPGLEAVRIRNQDGSRREYRLTALVAAVLALAIVVTLVFTARGFHPKASVPAAPPVQVKAPMRITAPGVGVCAAPCSLFQPAAVFVSATVGWFNETVGQSLECNPICNKTVLFRTDDGGFTWRAQLSWNGPPGVILASPDGREVLFVSPTSLQNDGTELIHSTDGGAHWTFSNGPPGVSSPFSIGPSSSSRASWYFLNPREGWVLTPEANSTVADLFHTSDSGAHWSMTRIDIKAEFNKAEFNRDRGFIVFRDSSTGWFVPAPGWDMYMTQDGGRTWQAQSLTVPVGVQPGLTPLIGVPPFPNRKDGVLTVCLACNLGAGVAWVSPVDYVYTTSDGGRHWSNPTSLPKVAVPGRSEAPAFFPLYFDVIDTTHWIARPVDFGGLMRTSDAGHHWDFIPASPDAEFTSMGFVDPSRGWALSTNSGTVLYWTTDGGLTWSPRSLPEPAR